MRERRGEARSLSAPAIVEEQRQEPEGAGQNGVAIGDPRDRCPVGIVNRIKQERASREPRGLDEATVHRRHDAQQKRIPSDAVQVHQARGVRP